MSLLREIQNDLASSGADAATVLRKCKILAARLSSEELSRWVDHELNGYPTTQPVPEYRLLPVHCYANFMNIGWRAENQGVPPFAVAKEYRDTFFAPIEFRDGIAIAMSYVSTGAMIDAPLLAVLIERHRKMYPGYHCTSAWRVTSGEKFEQLISAVKNRVLDFSLKIEAENPEAGEAPPNSQPVAQEKLQPLVQNIFYAPVGNLAQNSDHFSQISGVGLSSEDLGRLAAELAQHLDELKLNDRDRQKAKAQIAVLKAELAGEPDLGVVRQAGRTLRNITEGAIGSLLATAAQPTVWVWIHQMLQNLGAN
jgi:hypothetical protein